MTLAELKDFIKDNKLSDDLLVFKCEDDNGHFLANQYIDEICRTKQLVRTPIDSLEAITASSNSFMYSSDTTLFVIHAEKFDELYKGYYDFKNVIIVCDKVDKKVEAILTDSIITFPKLETWQIVAYIKTQISSLPDEQIEQLITACKNSVYKIQSEIDKLALFKPEEQANILAMLINTENSDLFDMPVFVVSDAIAKKEKLPIIRYLLHKQSCDIEALGIVTILLNKYKQILLATYTDGSCLNLSPKQINAIRYYNKGFSQEYLMNKIEFLSSIDYKLKNGELDISKDALMGYVLCSCFC